MDAIGFALDCVGKGADKRKHEFYQNDTEDNYIKNVKHIIITPLSLMNMKII